MIRSVDDELLEDICRDIALENYGFLYVNDHKSKLQEEYENADTGLMTTGSLSRSDIEETLGSLTENSISAFQRLRSGVYYYDPFNTREGSRVSDELKGIFTYDLVVNKQTIESRFDIAPTDVDYFADELENENFIRSIAAGERDYYVSGPRLKDETSGDASVDTQLQEEAKHGTISHTDLENVIDVAATSDIIRFLEKNDFIVDLDGEYLVDSAFDDYAQHLSSAVGDDVVEEFDDIGALPSTEFDQVLRNEIEERFDVLVHLDRSDTKQLMESVSEDIVDTYDLEVKRNLVVDPDPFGEYIEQRARQTRDDVENEHGLLPSPSDYEEYGYPEIDDLEVSDEPRLNEHVREAIRTEFDALVDERFSVDADAS